MTRPTPDVKRALAALRDRHGLDRETVAAMAFERSRQQNVSLPQALTDLVADLDATKHRRRARSSASPQPPEHG